MCNDYALEKLIILCEKVIKDYEIDKKDRNIYEFRDFTLFLIYYYSINPNEELKKKIKNNLEEIEKYLPSLLTINKDYFNNLFYKLVKEGIKYYEKNYVSMCCRYVY